jgi:hypothetical protein
MSEVSVVFFSICFFFTFLQIFIYCSLLGRFIDTILQEFNILLGIKLICSVIKMNLIWKLSCG